MLQLIKQLHGIANNKNLKRASEKIFLMLLTVKYLCNEVGFNTFGTIQSTTAAIRKKFLLRLQKLN